MKQKADFFEQKAHCELKGTNKRLSQNALKGQCLVVSENNITEDMFRMCDYWWTYKISALDYIRMSPKSLASLKRH